MMGHSISCGTRVGHYAVDFGANIHICMTYIVHVIRKLVRPKKRLITRMVYEIHQS